MKLPSAKTAFKLALTIGSVVAVGNGLTVGFSENPSLISQEVGAFGFVAGFATLAGLGVSRLAPFNLAHH